MKKTFYFDENRMIAFYSDGLNQTEKFQAIELEVTEEELEKIKQGWRASIKNNNLCLEKTDKITSEEKGKMIEETKKKLKEKGEKMSQKELIDTILQIIT